MLRSNNIARATGLTVVDKVISFIEGAGSKRESDNERDGFLSYHAESHAAGSGLGVGYALGASGRLRMLGVVLMTVLYGNNGDSMFGAKLFQDIRQELHYFIGGLIAGAIMGIISAAVVVKVMGFAP